MAHPIHPDISPNPSGIRRAAVIVPPLQDFYFTPHRFSSLGATIVVNLLRRAGIETNLFNFPQMRPKGGVIGLPDDLAYLTPFLIEDETGRLSFFTRFRHFGPSIDDCANMIAKANPEICLFSVFAFCYADSAIELSKAVRKRLPDLPLVAGGPGPGVHPGYFLGKGGFDYVLSGEAEVSLPPFMNLLNECKAHNRSAAKEKSAVLHTIPNLFRQENGTLRPSGVTAYADERDMEFVMVKSAESSRSVTYSTMLSRGCPKSCTFCSSRLTSGNSFRKIPVETIESALADLDRTEGDAESMKQIIINIEDDNFLADRVWFERAVEVFRYRFPGVKFIAENGIDHSFLTPAISQWLLSLGMTKFNLSIASLNTGILAASDRFLHRDRYEKIIEFLHEKSIPTVTYFICGFKDDTIDSTLANMLYLDNQHTLTGISLFYAVPGLPGFTDMSIFDGGSSSRCCGSAAYPWNNSLSTKTMITAFRLSRFSNLLKSGVLSEEEKQLTDIIIRKRQLHTMIKDKKNQKKIIVIDNQDSELVRRFFERFKGTLKIN